METEDLRPRRTDDRRGWRRQLRDTLRPEPRREPLSRRAVWADAVLAVLLTAVALFVAARYPGDGPINVAPVDPGAPVPPRPPSPGRWLAEEEPAAPPFVLVVLSALPLAVRRRYPFMVFAVVMGAVLAIGDDASWINVLTCVVAPTAPSCTAGTGWGRWPGCSSRPCSPGWRSGTLNRSCRGGRALRWSC